MELELDQLLKELVKKANTLPYIIYIKDSSERFLYLNEASCRLLGNDVNCIDDLKSINRESIFYKRLFANDLDLIKEHISQSKVYFIEEDETVQPGSPLSNARCFYFTKLPVMSKYIVGFGIEITNILVQSNTLQFFKNILNSMKDSVIITDPAYPYGIRYVNAAFTKLTGYTEAEALGKSPTQLLGRDNSEDSIRKIFDKKIAQKKITEAILTNTTKLGRTFKSHITVIPLYDAEQKHIFYMGIQRDISSNLQLKELEKIKSNKLKAIFNGTSNYLWLVDNDGPRFTVLEMNLSARTQGKYLEVNQLSFPEGRWFKARKENKQKIIDFLATTLEQGQKQKLTIDFLDSLDQFRTVRLTSTPYRLDDGDIDYVVVEGSDISELEAERKRVESIASTVIKENYSVEQLEADRLLDEWNNAGMEGESLERLIKTETTVFSQLVPSIDELKKTVLDPESGLVVKQNEILAAVNSIKGSVEKTTKLSESIEMLSNLWQWSKHPLVRTIALLLIGASTFNTVENLATSVFGIKEAVHNQEVDTTSP